MSDHNSLAPLTDLPQILIGKLDNKRNVLSLVLKFDVKLVEFES